MPLRCPTGLVPDDERLSQGRRLDPLARRSALIRSTFSFSAAAQIASSSFVLARGRFHGAAVALLNQLVAGTSLARAADVRPSLRRRSRRHARLEACGSSGTTREKRRALTTSGRRRRVSKRAQSFGAERELALSVANRMSLAQLLKREQEERLVVQIS